MTEMIIAGPAIPATIPVIMKIPDPMIAPIPSAVVPNRPISRFNPALSAVNAITTCRIEKSHQIILRDVMYMKERKGNYF